MKIHLITLLGVALTAFEFPETLALTRDLASQCITCPDEFKGKMVCAFLNGCHLQMEYCSMLVFNCARQVHHRHLFLVMNEGRCQNVRGPECTFMDF
ncbi:uncharacterized protein LOC108112232 [Drosophila eugracilis]|uniref:uncharacterized protein LOC108112232 n=1 Tax=Drosophila eugracilis TaxID=29029 RepID=UPI0007E799BA|nr:uncharacterized protein LOC108112232 [Drosophila eugracilis]